MLSRVDTIHNSNVSNLVPLIISHDQSVKITTRFPVVIFVIHENTG